MAFKYIVYVDDGLERCLIFDKLTNHSDFKHRCTKILGAGFLYIRHTLNEDDLPTIQFECEGKSDSLGVASRGELDAEILEKEYRRRH